MKKIFLSFGGVVVLLIAVSVLFFGQVVRAELPQSTKFKLGDRVITNTGSVRVRNLLGQIVLTLPVSRFQGTVIGGPKLIVPPSVYSPTWFWEINFDDSNVSDGYVGEQLLDKIPPPSTKFAIGDRVRENAGGTVVRVSPDTYAAKIATVRGFDQGVIVGGPVYGVYPNGNYVWRWKVSWEGRQYGDSKFEGWSPEELLIKEVNSKYYSVTCNKFLQNGQTKENFIVRGSLLGGAHGLATVNFWPMMPPPPVIAPSSPFGSFIPFGPTPLPFNNNFIGFEQAGATGVVYGGPTYMQGNCWWKTYFPNKSPQGWMLDSELNKNVTLPTATSTQPVAKFKIGDVVKFIAVGALRSSPSIVNPFNCGEPGGGSCDSNVIAGRENVLIGTRATIKGDPYYNNNFDGHGRRYVYYIEFSDGGPNGYIAENYLDFYTPPVEVSCVGVNFVNGDRVKVKNSAGATVRSDDTSQTVGGKPPTRRGLNVFGSQPFGALGTVVGSPVLGTDYCAVKVNFDSGADGWVVSDDIEKNVTLPTATSTQPVAKFKIGDVVKFIAVGALRSSPSIVNPFNCGEPGGGSCDSNVIAGRENVLIGTRATIKGDPYYNNNFDGHGRRYVYYIEFSDGGPNGYIAENYLDFYTPPAQASFSIGDRIITTKIVGLNNYESSFNTQTLNGSAQDEARQGVIIEGPKVVNNKTFWNVDFDFKSDPSAAAPRGIVYDGWVEEDLIKKFVAGDYPQRGMGFISPVQGDQWLNSNTNKWYTISTRDQATTAGGFWKGVYGLGDTNIYLRKIGDVNSETLFYNGQLGYQFPVVPGVTVGPNGNNGTEVMSFSWRSYLYPVGSYQFVLKDSHEGWVYRTSESGIFSIVTSNIPITPTSTTGGVIIASDSFTSPTTIGVGVSGQWRIKATDQNGYDLTYRVVWGDGRYDTNTMSSGSTVVVRHAYLNTGNYTAALSVTDRNNKTVSKNLVVTVGGVNNPPPTGICGDVNADGAVTIRDASAIIDYIFGGRPLTGGSAVSDVNGDGRVNISDAVYLVSYINTNGSAPRCATTNTTDNIVPTVTILSPVSNSTVTGASVSLSASASDNVGVAGVQFKLDGVNIGAEDTTSPYAITWNSTQIANGGFHTLTAVARDVAGNRGTSQAVTVTVFNTPPPTGICGDVNADGAVTIRDASAIIDYIFGGRPLTGGSAVSDVNGDGRVNISDAVYLVSYINTNGSAPRCATTNTTDNIVPTVTILSPVSNSTVTGASVSLSASASDNVGVAGVQFKLDDQNLGAEDVTSPYSIAWNTAQTTNGSHTLKAVARDAAGNLGTSQAVSVTVSNTAANPVSSKFNIGDRVEVTTDLRARLTPDLTGNISGVQTARSLGTITRGSVWADNYFWWEVNYDNGADGWSVEDYLKLATGVNPPPVNNSPTITADSLVSPTNVTVGTSNWWRLQASDSDSPGPLGYSISWGDGGADNFSIANGDLKQAFHTYNIAGTYTVMFTATDSQGASKTKSLTVVVAGTGTGSVGEPIVINPSSFTSPTSVKAGEENWWLVQAINPNHNGASLRVDIVWGDGSQSGYGNMFTWIIGSGHGLRAYHTYGTPGTYTAKLKLTEEIIGSSQIPKATISKDLQITVLPSSQSSLAPLIPDFTFLGPTYVKSGALSSWKIQAQVKVSASMLYAINWGDGTSSGQSLNSNQELVVYHTYNQTGNFTALLTITDASGGRSTKSLAVTAVAPSVAQNQAPEIIKFTGPTNTKIGVWNWWDWLAIDPESGAIFPANGVNNFSASVDWGDGKTSSCSGCRNDILHLPFFSHVYEQAGNYNVVLTVNDGQGGTATRSIPTTISAGVAQ